jgi:hypothetical protein
MPIVNVVERRMNVIIFIIAVVSKKLKDFGANAVLSTTHFKHVPSAKMSFVKNMAILIRTIDVDYYRLVGTLGKDLPLI